VRKRWRVITRNLSLREMEEYGLHRGWTYELVPPEEPKPPESRPVRANTRFRGLRWDIVLDSSWNSGQVACDVEDTWREELEKRPVREGMTEVVTRDAQDRRTAFAVHEGRTYELVPKEWQGPEWVNKLEYKPQPRPAKPNEEIMVGMQLEDGIRIERKVKAETGEVTLKRTMWQELNPPEGHYHLYIQNTRGEDEGTYGIRHQWTYRLST
jgi:hypothetical protein